MNSFALYKDVKTFTGLDSGRYQIDGMFNLGLLYQEQYKLLDASWDPEIRKKKRTGRSSPVSPQAIYLKKDSFEDKKSAMEYASGAWEHWKQNRQAWGDRQDIFDTYGASLKAMAVGIAMTKEPDYDRIIQVSNLSLQIPNYADRYYMNYLLSYASYQKGDEERFYRHGKEAVQVILDKYANEFDKVQTEEEKEVLMLWVNSLRGSGGILEAMRYQKIEDQVGNNAM